MRYLFGTIVLCVLITSCGIETRNFGSSFRQKNNTYTKDMDNHNKRIVGHWKFETDSSLFKITLKEYKKFRWIGKKTHFKDLIFGKYSYKVNGKLLSSIDSIRVLPNAKVFFQFYSPNHYNGYVKDSLSNKHKSADFRFINDSTATLKFKDSEGIVLDGSTKKFVLPMMMMLEKIND